MESDDVLEYVSGLRSPVFIKGRGRDVWLHDLRLHYFLDDSLVDKMFVVGKTVVVSHWAPLNCVRDEEVRSILLQYWEEDNGNG